MNLASTKLMLHDPVVENEIFGIAKKARTFKKII